MKSVSFSVVSYSLWPHGLYIAHQDLSVQESLQTSPGRDTGVGSHSLLQGLAKGKRNSAFSYLINQHSKGLVEYCACKQTSQWVTKVLIDMFPLLCPQSSLPVLAFVLCFNYNEILQMLEHTCFHIKVLVPLLRA